MPFPNSEPVLRSAELSVINNVGKSSRGEGSRASTEELRLKECLIAELVYYFGGVKRQRLFAHRKAADSLMERVHQRIATIA